MSAPDVSPIFKTLCALTRTSSGSPTNIPSSKISTTSFVSPLAACLSSCWLSNVVLSAQLTTASLIFFTRSMSPPNEFADHQSATIKPTSASSPDGDSPGPSPTRFLEIFLISSTPPDLTASNKLARCGNAASATLLRSDADGLFPAAISSMCDNSCPNPSRRPLLATNFSKIFKFFLTCSKFG